MKKILHSNQKGETLVETIVSFAVVMLVLVTITSVVRLATNLNGVATKRAEELETVCTAIEAGSFTGVTAVESSLELRLPDNTTLSIPIDVYDMGMLMHFTPHTDGG